MNSNRSTIHFLSVDGTSKQFWFFIIQCRCEIWKLWALIDHVVLGLDVVWWSIKHSEWQVEGTPGNCFLCCWRSVSGYGEDWGVEAESGTPEWPQPSLLLYKAIQHEEMHKNEKYTHVLYRLLCNIKLQRKSANFKLLWYMIAMKITFQEPPLLSRVL